MKRIFFLVLATLVVAGLGLGLARPDLLPAWARLGGLDRSSDDIGLFCKEHGVPEKFCTLCHAELKTTLMLCKEHGNIPEDICTLCHPEVEKKYKLQMCAEHGLPEHFCSQCGNGPSASVATPDDGWCALHNTPEALCRQCEAGVAKGVASRPAACRQPLPTVRFASPKIARQIGLETTRAIEESHAHLLTANAEIDYDANRSAEVAPRVAGYLREVRADLGQVVRAGEVLAIVDAAEVGAAKTRYLAAHAADRLARENYERTHKLAESHAASPKAELEDLTARNQAEADLLDAEQTLRNLGLDDSALALIVARRDTQSTLEIVAPISGTVVLRNAVQGEAVQPTTMLFAVADTSRMWLWIDVYEANIADVAPGQDVTFTLSGTASMDEAPTARGSITWVGTEVNPTTRTTRVRAELENPDGHLRAHQFGRAAIRLGDEHEAIVVPKRAIQRKDGADLVFLTNTAGVYRPHRVITRPANRPDVVEVAWGLQPGDRIVTHGSFWLKTEIMKGAIGAGCCE